MINRRLVLVIRSFKLGDTTGGCWAGLTDCLHIPPFQAHVSAHNGSNLGFNPTSVPFCRSFASSSMHERASPSELFSTSGLSNMMAQLEIGHEGRLRGRRSRLSPSMEVFKRKLMEWLTSNEDEKAVQTFQTLMREGVSQGGGKSLPAEYRPDGQMLDELYRAMIRLHESEGGKLSSSLLAHDLCKSIKEAMAWSKMAGHVPSASVYGQLLKSYRRLQQADKVDAVVQDMKAHGYELFFASEMTVILTHLECRNLVKAWSLLEPLMIVAPSHEGRNKSEMDRLLSICMSLMRLAAHSLSFDLVSKVKTRLSEMNHKIDTAVLVDCTIAAASSGDLILTEEFLQGLAGSTELVQSENGKDDLQHVKVEEGTMLLVMRAAMRAQDSKMGLRIAKQAFELLKSSQARSYFHSRAYYSEVVGKEMPLDSKPSALDHLSRPSPVAYLALLNASVKAGDFKESFSILYDLEISQEKLIKSNAQDASEKDAKMSEAVFSPLHGLRFFSEFIMKDEATVAMAYDELSARHASGKPVTTSMLNVILRALALVSKGDSAVEATGRLFEEFAAAGLEHNVDSYNAVIEACVGAKKLAAVQSLVGLMEAGKAAEFGKAPPPHPNADTWDLLVHAHMYENDFDGLLVTLQKNVNFRISTLRQAYKLTKDLNHHTAAHHLRSLIFSPEITKAN